MSTRLQIITATILVYSLVASAWLSYMGPHIRL